LKSWQIDPFGATVIFDKDLGQFRYQSQEESQALARRKLAKDTIDDLVKIGKDLADKSGSVQGDYGTKIKTGIETALAEMGKSLPVTPTVDRDSSVTGRKAKGFIKFKVLPSDGDSITLEDDTFTFKDKANVTDPKTQIEIVPGELPKTLSKVVEVLKGSKYALIGRVVYGSDGKDLLTITYATEGNEGNAFKLAVGAAAKAQVSGKSLEGGDKTGPCPAGFEVRRGFQLLGPQGVTTFNQDDRLILAMSTSAQPLIGTLNEISSRALEQEPTSSATLLPLVAERLKISEAQRAVQDKDAKSFGVGDIDAVKKALGE
jgi:hypothetical protein